MRTPRPNDSLDLVDPTAYAFTRTTWVNAAPAVVYELISNVSMISTWSLNASDVSYDDGEGPRVGAWFSGRNRKDDRSWASRSQVCRADPAVAFGFVVGGIDNGIVHWEWTFIPSGTGTHVQQSWQLLRTDPLLGATRADLDALRDYMVGSVETTLVSLARWIDETQLRDSA